MKTYTIKKLIRGTRIGLEDTDYVAVPDIDYNKRVEYNDGDEIAVDYKGEKRKIESWNKAVTYRTFEDKLKRGYYKLGYFKWNEQKKINTDRS
jgi:hypothetical protein